MASAISEFLWGNGVMQKPKSKTLGVSYFLNPIPWPRPLAQTWHAGSESHSSCLLNIKAVIAFYDHVAPGQAGMARCGDAK